MPLTVLSDEDVRKILLGLSKEDVLDLQQSLADALHYYSTATEDDRNGCCSSYQPMRTALKRGDGQTTLFMPASSNEGLGVKIVTLSVPNSSSKKDGSSKKSRSGSDTTWVSESLDSLSLASGTTTTTNTTTTHHSSQSAATTSTVQSSQSTTPKGTLQILDQTGAARGFMNAEEITAFRTALASTMMFKKRHNVHDIVVFGAGKQAYWHIRLALLLRGPEIHHLNIINRSYETAKNMMTSLFTDGPGETALHRPKIQILTPSANEYERLLKATVRSSSVIFFTTPSLTPLFPAEYLTSTEGRKKGRYLAAIGSYKPHMIEIHPDILRQNVEPEHTRHFHKHAKQGGAVIVDSVEACLKEAGEIIQAGLSGRELVELGELIMLKKDAEKRRQEARSRHGSSHRSSEEAEQLDANGVELGEAKHGKSTLWSKKKRSSTGGSSGKSSQQDVSAEDKTEASLTEWLQKGNVIYKSVGLGLMDVVVGGDIVRLADERNIGTRIENF